MKRSIEKSAAPSPLEIEDLPEVQEHALQAEGGLHNAVPESGGNNILNTSPSLPGDASTSPSGQSGSPAEGIAAPSGELWNPDHHERPRRVNSKGGWAKLRGGKKGGRDSIALPPKEKPQAPAVDEAGNAARMQAAAAAAAADDAAKTIQLQAAGEGCAAMTFGVAQSLGGIEYAPREGEFEAVSAAYAAYLKAKDLSDIPPGAMLAVVLASVFGKRPSLWAKAKGWFNRHVMGRGPTVEHGPVDRATVEHVSP